MATKSVNAKSQTIAARVPHEVIETMENAKLPGESTGKFVTAAIEREALFRQGISQPGGVLTDQKRQFADYLLSGHSKAEAARLAGYGEKSASSKGSQLSKEPVVIAYMESRKKPE